MSCSHGMLSVLQLLDNDDKVPWKKYRSKIERTGSGAAMCGGEYAVAEWLLRKQIYHPDEVNYHSTALFTAAWDKDTKLTSLLLFHGADPLAGHERGFISPILRGQGSFTRLLKDLHHHTMVSRS